MNKLELYLNPKHYTIFEHKGAFWIQQKVQGEKSGQPERLIDFLKHHNI